MGQIIKSSSVDDVSTCGNDEYVLKKKRRSVEPQSNKEVKWYGALSLTNEKMFVKCNMFLCSLETKNCLRVLTKLSTKKNF